MLDARLANAPEAGQSADNLMKKKRKRTNEDPCRKNRLNHFESPESETLSVNLERVLTLRNRINNSKIPGAKRDTAVLQSLIKEAIVFRVGRGWTWNLDVPGS